MFDINKYYPKDKAGTPYKDSNENFADYMTLAWSIADMGIVWRDECDEEECMPPRGIKISDDNKKSIEILRNTPFEERNEPVLVPEIQALVREGLEYITSREDAVKKQNSTGDGDVSCTDILRIRNIIDTFKLTKRMTVLMALLLAARGDIHILEAFSYIAADKSILETGTPTIGLVDMLLHLIFEYEVIQAETVYDKRGTFARYLIKVSGEGEAVLQKRISICNYVYKYIMFGASGFPKKPEKPMPGTSIYYDDFAKNLSLYENYYNNKDRAGDYCYIRAKDTEDAIHVLTKVFEENGRPLYVISPEEVKAGNKDLFFMLRMMRYLHNASVLVRLNSEEKINKSRDDDAKMIADIIHTLKNELPHMNTIYLTGTISFPSIDVHGMDSPAILTLDMPDIAMRHTMWQELFEVYSLIPGNDVDLMDIADCHDLCFGQIRTIVERCAARLRMTSIGGIVKRNLLQEMLFSLSNVDFEHLATQVDARYTWDDIFLEASQKKYLKYACDRFRLRNRIGAQWELTKKNAYGNAVIVLMYGPPGTGKTMAAQVVANEVMTPLYRVDVSQIFSKYIGETQKNISRIFEEAQKRNVVLFFDEADALFTRRTEIKDSHDKYANSDTSFLLQKVEEYNGISILATNNFQSFDPAFMRRLTYVIRFERPDEDTRRAMWHSMMSD